MKNRLIELLQDIDRYPEKTCPKYGTGEECGDCQYKLETEKGCDLYARKADYMIAKGLMYPPCKVDDILYEIDLPEYGVITCKVKKVLYINYHLFGVETNEIVSVVQVDVTVIDGHGKDSEYYFEFDDFGKTVFLTKKEAEQALKERENK